MPANTPWASCFLGSRRHAFSSENVVIRVESTTQKQNNNKNIHIIAAENQTLDTMNWILSFLFCHRWEVLYIYLNSCLDKSVLCSRKKIMTLMMMRRQTSGAYICIINISDYCQVTDTPDFLCLPV